ncbi:MAG: PAS domain-containing protein [Haloarculaceae archaeon]
MAHSDGSGESLRVVYVNDDRAFTDLVEAKLGRRAPEFDVETVADADAAVDRVAETAVDCLVTAYSLPDGTGIDLVERVQDRNEDLPTVLFTASGSEQIASRATRADVSDYVPVRAQQANFELLASRVRTLVDAARERERARRATDRFRRTLERTTDAVYAVDREWQIEYMNETMADRVDRDPDDVVGATLWDEFPEITGTELEDRYRTAMETGDPVSFEQHFEEPSDYWAEIRAFPDEDGITVFSREVTEERERALHLDRDETILQNVHDVVLVVDESGTVRFANSAAARVFGEPRADRLVGSRLAALVGGPLSESDADRLVRAVDETLEGAEADGGVTGLYDSDLRLGLDPGSGKRTFDVRLTPFRSADSRQVLLVGRDVTEQSEAQQQLERERDALRELQGVIADSGLSTDERLSELLAVGCRTLGLDAGLISRVEGDECVVRAAHAPGTDVDAGDRFALESTYCERVVRQDAVCSFTDPETADLASHPALVESAPRSYIGVPLVVDGERYGTLNFSSPTTRPDPFDALERTFVELLAELVSTELSRGRSRTELERTNRRLASLVETAPLGIAEFDPDGDVQVWNRGAEEMFGLTGDEAGELFDLPGSAEEASGLSAHLRRALDGERVRGVELQRAPADGDRLDLLLSAAPATGPDGDVTSVIATFEDITERKDRERERRRLVEEYDALLDNSGDAIFLLDVDSAGGDVGFRFRRLSPGYETQTGLTTEEVRDRTPREVFGDERGAELEANYRRCVEQREPISYREELQVAEDARFWETSLAPVVVDGEILRIVGIARNVTEQVERERALERANQRLESLIDAAPLTIMEIDPTGEVLLWNSGAEEMFGWSSEEVVGEFNPMVPADKQSEFSAHRERALAGEQIRGKEIRRETKDGDRLDLLLSAAPITDPDGEVTSVIAVLEDITDQKRLENRLRKLQETARELSVARSTEEIGEIAVDAAVDVLGLEVTGIWEYDGVSDALVPITESEAARELLGESPRFTPGDSLAWEAFDSGELRVYDDVHAESRAYNPETEISSEILVPLGEYGLISTGSPDERVFSEAEVDLFRILGATVEAALARADREETLRRQNERLDQFASVVAHDIRNPLTVAMGFLDAAERTGDEAHFEKIESAHDRIERLIDDLLALARGEATVEDAEQVGLEPVATEAWGYVDTREATFTVAEGTPAVAADAGRLTQLFENLFRNAVEHGGADVTVTLGPLSDAPGFYVEDDGAGIPPAKRDEVFEHGVTSREGGTGFGLPIVADVANAHGWTVSVTEGDAGGARFEFETA